MGIGGTGLIIALAWGLPARAEEAKDGQIGVKFDLVAEGAVIQRVRPGMGAEQAGIRVGDLVTDVNGSPIEDRLKDAGRQIRGPVGSTVQLTVRGPFGGAEREVDVERSKRVAIHRSDRMDPALARFRAALRTGRNVHDARDATQGLIAAGFSGKTAGAAVGSALLRAARKHPRIARTAIELLQDQAPGDGQLRYRIGEALFAMDDFEGAVKALDQAGEAWGADVRGEAWTGWVGTDSRRLELLANSLWDIDQQDRARTVAAELGLTLDVPGLWDRLGMENPAPRVPMLAHLPPVDAFKTDLLGGGTWALEEQGDKVVLLAFWATWCGPCRREMPELAEMWEALHDRPFEMVAVSVDEAGTDKVRKTAEKWKLPFPVAHDRALGRAFEVTGLPAIRLLGGDGSLRFAGSGYSSTGVAKLAERVDKLMAEVEAGALSEGQRVGDVWTTGTAELTGFSVVNGALSVAAGPDRVVVGARGAAPVVLPVVDGAVGAELERDVSTLWRRISGRVVWFDGAVGGHPGGLWLRAFDPEGDIRWFETLSSPMVDFAVSGDHLWVAMQEGLAVLNAEGKVLATHDLSALDIASAGDGAVWVVDGKTRYRVTVEGIASSDGAADSAAIDESGTWARAGVVEMVQGRFGPEGDLRRVAVRKDDVIVGLDGEGRPAFSLKIDAAPGIAVIDLDGDGRDELLVTIRRHGVATVKLEIP